MTNLSYGPAIVSNYVYREPLVTSRETPPGSNRGPLVDKVLRYVLGNGADLNKRSPAENEWCAGMYCLATFEAGVKNGPKTLSTGGLFDWHYKEIGAGRVIYVPRNIRGGRVKAVGKQLDALPGDGGLVLNDASPTAFRHTTCLVSPLGGGWWRCIAGNEGNKISYSTRHLSTMAIVRPY